MNKLKEIPIGTVIKLSTKEESIELSKLLDSNGYRWLGGKNLIKNNYWNVFKEHTLYVINENKKVSFGHICYAFKNILTLEEFKQKYMETKELKIKIPFGYVIDEENSTFKCIKFKPKKITYEDVAKYLFSEKPFYIDSHGNVIYSSIYTEYYTDPNNATSQKQLEKLLAINKLMNVRKYLCPDYVVKKDESAYSIYIDSWDNSIKVARVNYANYIDVFFPNEIRAWQAVEILGEDVIRLACSNDY